LKEGSVEQMLFLIFGFLIFGLGCLGDERMSREKSKKIEEMEEFGKLRKEMVEYQIRRRGIKDERVLRVMEKVPRHVFIPEDFREEAYEDHPVSIGKGQTISQPYIVALMTECLKLDGSEKVLEIGTGSGYQAAILAELAKEVYTIEIIPELGRRAEKILCELGYKNIKVKIGNGYIGWAENAPYDAIIVTCAPDHIPQPLIEQLKDDGGRMVIPVGELFQELLLVEKKKGKVSITRITGCVFVPMTGEYVK
jgi:protein-L-isoaspartate(D-aspartate) O-methyltransferase